MAGRPIKETKTRTPIAKRKKDRQKALIAACRRSGFDGFEMLQILADLYGWQKLVITSAPGITEHTITNAWSQSRQRRSTGVAMDRRNESVGIINILTLNQSATVFPFLRELRSHNPETILALTMFQTEPGSPFRNFI
jgi:hypothetical protein